MRTSCALLVVCALLSGCASTKAPGWTKTGMTEEQLERDRMECLTGAQRVRPSAGGPRMSIDHSHYEQCMAGRGYVAASPK